MSGRLLGHQEARAHASGGRARSDHRRHGAGRGNTTRGDHRDGHRVENLVEEREHPDATLGAPTGLDGAGDGCSQPTSAVKAVSTVDYLRLGFGVQVR